MWASFVVTVRDADTGAGVPDCQITLRTAR
jgi:hypothetical protein